MFVWFAWYRLIFAKGMNNRNTFVFVCVFQGLRLMSPLMGVFLNVLNITPQRALDDGNPPICYLMFKDYIQQAQRLFIFCSAQPVES